MKKNIKNIIFLYLIIIAQSFFISNTKVLAQDISISAKSAIVICADSGDVIYSKNEKSSMPIASTTKIMTSILALENMEAYGNSEVKITDEMVKVEGTSMGLMPNDIVTIDALVKGMLLCSGNDAANAIAIMISGSQKDFAFLMNEKAKSIGMENTYFVTPSGLDKDNNHSCAYDMAILGAYAMENSTFRDIVSKKSLKVNFVNPKKTVSYKNHNKLLRLYEHCIGIKTGFTKLAGRCLVSCSEKDDIRLVAVTLNAPNDWDDHINLYNYSFPKIIKKVFDDRNFSTTIPVINGDMENLKIVGSTYFSSSLKIGDDEKIQQVIDIPPNCEAPVEKGRIIGSIKYYLNNREIGKNNVIAENSINIQIHKKNFFNNIIDFFKNLLWF